MRSRSRAAALAAFALLVVAFSGGLLGARSADGSLLDSETGSTGDGARRVLVFAVPHLTWGQLEAADAPNLKRLLSGSAVASLAVRVERLATRSGDGYTTIGAGTRAIADAGTAGLTLERGEAIENGVAADVFERRNGRALDGVAGQMWIGSILDENDKALFGGTPGALGDALASRGRTSGVVANADSSIADTGLETFHREAAMALMGSNGGVRCGSVGRELLVEDPGASFGIRLDPRRVASAFDTCWRGRAVVLVEASDLARAEAYRSRAVGDQGDRLFSEAIESADALLGDLLDRVDLTQDAVVVVAPASPQGAAQLTVMGVHAPQMRPGLLASASTRQPGFVTIQDVGPTIAQLAGIERPEEMEGRAATVDSTGGDARRRFATLVDADRDARFRDKMIASVVAFYIALQIILSVGIALSLARRDRRLERILEIAALGLLGALPLTYLAALLPFSDWGGGAYAIFLVGGGTAIGVMANIARRQVLRPLELVFGLMLGVTAVSVMLLHSRLQLSTVFGDSPIVAGRFSGVNNVSFSQLMVAAILLAAFVVHRNPGRRGLLIAGVLMAAVLLIDTAPMWGADVGGLLAGMPALLLAIVLLGHWRVRVRLVIAAGVATLGSLMVLGLVDLMRPSSERTHLGRLFERIGADGWNGFATVVERKLNMNFATLTGSVWSMMVVPMLLFAAVLVWRAPARLRAVLRQVPELRAAFFALCAAGVLGYALNDSGIAVPGMMLAVANPAISYLLVRVESDTEPADV